MNGRTFIDSNVLLYAAQKGVDEKSARCAAWVRYLQQDGLGVSNLQVMNEVTNVLTKRARMPPEAAFAIVDGYSIFGTEPINQQTVAAARIIRFDTSYSWWDCVLLAAAVELQCTRFLTEDLQDGHKVRGLTIISPFRHSPPHIPLH